MPSELPLRNGRRAAVLGGALVVASGLVACNAILGLNDFEKVDSVGVDAGPDVFVPSGGGVDSGPDAPLPPIPSGVATTTWARWHMPEAVKPLGQPPPAYTPDAAVAAGAPPVVVDRVTGLTWMRDPLPGTYSTFESARDACKNQTGGPWRVPSRIELVSILDHTRENPALPVSDAGLVFTGITSGNFWTSSVVRPLSNPIKFWAVEIRSGTVLQDVGTGSVRCVKGT